MKKKFLTPSMEKVVLMCAWDPSYACTFLRKCTQCDVSIQCVVTSTTRLSSDIAKGSSISSTAEQQSFLFSGSEIIKSCNGSETPLPSLLSFTNCD